MKVDLCDDGGEPKGNLQDKGPVHDPKGFLHRPRHRRTGSAGNDIGEEDAGCGSTSHDAMPSLGRGTVFEKVPINGLEGGELLSRGA